MRCHQARQRLMASGMTPANHSRDKELQEHLRQCPECRLWAQAEKTLQRDLPAMAHDDTTDVVPLAALRTRVEAHVRDAVDKRFMEISLMSRFANKLKSRPRLGATLGIVTALLLIATLVPLKMDQTVGYEVALAGVNKDLAMDNEKITILLNALGVESADVTLGECEATCKLTISELKTEDDVELIVAAFDELGNCVLERVTEITEPGSVSIYSAARIQFQEDKVVFDDAVIHIDDKTHQEVLACLEQFTDDSGYVFNIWIDRGEAADGFPQNTITMDFANCDGADVHTLTAGLNGEIDAKAIGIVESDGGRTVMTFTDADGNRHTVDLDDPDAQAQLAALGGSAAFFSGGDSVAFCKGIFIDSNGRQTVVDCPPGCGDSIAMKIIYCDPSQCATGASDGDGEAAKTATEALPEGYDLSQNYPNPFNPSTEIDFSLAQSQPVLLQVFNIQGQLVATLADDVFAAGRHTVQWNGTAADGSPVASGVYLYRLEAGEFAITKKMSLVK